MGGIRMTRNDLATYEMLSRAGGDIKSGMMQYGLSRAADVKPEMTSSTEFNDTTPGTDGMVYDEDTGQYVPQYFVAPKTLSEQAVGQQQGESAPQGMRPTFTAKTTTRHKMGDKEQAEPFSREQIDAERFRNQADVYSRFGLDDKAASVYGLAKGREEEGIANQIRTAATAGMKNTKDMREDEKNFAMAKNMWEASVRLKRPDLATGYYQQMQQSREWLLSNSWDRAERVRRSTVSDANPTGSIAGFIDVQNKYVGNGLMIPEFRENVDGKGSVWLKVKDEIAGTETETTIPKEKIGDYLLQLKDIKKVEAIEQARAKSLFDEQIKTREELSKPQKVGKDEALVIPNTGQVWANPRAGQFDVKEQHSVLKEIDKMFLERGANFDQASGKWNYQPEQIKKSSIGQRLYAANPSLMPAQVVEIVDNGQTGTATIETGGKQVKLPAVTHNGRTYILGGADVGQAIPAQPSKPMTPSAALRTKEQVVPREVIGKIGGMQKAPAMPAQQGKAEPIAYNAPELDKIAVAAAEENGVPPSLLLALKNAGEKSNNNQVSPKGAAGVMQFMPETAKAYGVDPTNPESAIKGASRYIADLIKQYRGNVAAAVAHYNGGSTQGALVAAGKSPSYPETRAYLERVLAASGAPA